MRHTPSEFDLIGGVFISLAIAAVYGYGGISAFSIRQRLSGNLYRNQGLGIALLIILFGIFSVDLTLLPVYTGPLVFFVLYITFLGAFYWMDTSIRAARFTDPLYRDSLSWTKLRFALWAYDFFSIAVVLVLVFVLSFPNNSTPTSSNPLIQNNVISLLLFPLVIFGPVIVALIGGLIVFPVVAKRSADAQLKGHFRWFAVYALVLLSTFVGSFFFSNGLYDLFQGSILAPAGYFLYKSARSLVPIYKLPSRTT